MKKNTKKTETTAPAAAAPAPQAEAAPNTAAQTESKPDVSRRSPATGEAKADFYARLMADRPAEAASIMATLCRRKDKALRVMVDAHNAGKDAAECIREAMAVAFPRKQEAAT